MAYALFLIVGGIPAVLFEGGDELQVVLVEEVLVAAGNVQAGLGFGLGVLLHQEEDDEDCWGESNSMNAVTAPTKTEMIITGATGSSIDKGTYTEKNIAEAVKQIKASKTAEQNFSGKVNDDDEDTSDWGEVDEDDGDEPW